MTAPNLTHGRDIRDQETKTMMNFTFHADPAHGWLAVPHATLAASGIAASISRYSYMDRSYAYLEEDGDASRFLSTLTDYAIKETHTNGDSFIRSLPHFDAARSLDYVATIEVVEVVAV